MTSWANPALETQIQHWKLKSSSRDSNPAPEAQIQLWRLKSSPGHSTLAQELQIHPWRLKCSSGDSNPALEAQIQLWRLKSNPACSYPTLEAQIQHWTHFRPWALQAQIVGGVGILICTSPPSTSKQKHVFCSARLRPVRVDGNNPQGKGMNE